MTHLALASGLFQTIGMFHKDPEQRAKSNVYHGMIVMVRLHERRQPSIRAQRGRTPIQMLRMNGYMEQARDCPLDPFDLSDPISIEKAWRQWVKYETAKR